MPASMARKVARAAKFKAFVFQSNSTQRIVDGIRYDILPIPGAQTDRTGTLLTNAYDPREIRPHTIRRREVRIPHTHPDCLHVGCGRSAAHITTFGNFCGDHFSPDP